MSKDRTKGHDFAVISDEGDVIFTSTSLGPCLRFCEGRTIRIYQWLSHSGWVKLEDHPTFRKLD